MLGLVVDRVAVLGFEKTESLPVVLRAMEVLETEPEAALTLVSDVLTPQRRRTEPAARGLAGMLRARILRDRGKYHPALAAVHDAASDLRLAALPREVVRADLAAVRILREMGSARQAIDVASELLQRPMPAPVAVSVIDESAHLQAAIQIELAISLVAARRHDEALFRLDDAWNRVRAFDDRAMEAEAARGRAKAYLGLGMVHRAVDELYRVRESFEELQRPLDAARCSLLIGECLALLTPGPQAVRMLESLRSTLIAHQAAPEIACLALELGGALMRAGLVHDALAEYDEAAERMLDLGRIDDAGRAYLEVGLGYVLLDERDAAREHLEVAERLLVDTPDPELAVASRMSRAWLAGVEGDSDVCVHLATEALELIERHGTMISAGHHVHALLLSAHGHGDPAASSRLLDRASQLVTQKGLAEDRLHCVVVEARLYLLQGDRDKAIVAVRDALSAHLAGVVRERVSEVAAVGKLSVALAFEELITMLLEQNTHRSLVEAWRWMSILKVVVSEDYASAILRHRQRRTLGEEALRPLLASGPEAFALSRQIDELSRSEGPPDREALHRARTDARRVLRHQLRSARLNLPVGAPRVDSPIPEGPLLQMHVLGADVVVMVLREGQVYARRLPGAAATSRRLLTEWWIECSQLAHLGPVAGCDRAINPSVVPASLRALGALLLEPLADLLEDLPEGTPLGVVGHKHLDEVPLEAMQLGGRPMVELFDMQFAVGLDPAIVERAVPGVPDAAPGRRRGSGVLVLAVPDESAPSIADEAAGVGAIHPGATVLVGESATTDVLARQGASYALVHLACHGMFDAEHPRGSAVRLADRWLAAGEILELDLTDTIMVLNACSTGRLSKTGADMGGLVWSFLAAGCAGVVSTTWPVDDVVATDFALEFHRRVAAGDEPSAAVAAARARVAANHPHPWEWASFRYTSAADLVLQ